MRNLINWAVAALLTGAGCAGAVVSELPVSGIAALDATGFPGTTGPLPSLTVLSGGPTEAMLTAPGGLFRESGILTTEFDLDPIDVSFTAPVFAVAFNVAIIDFGFTAIAGTMRFTVDGQTFDKSLPAMADNIFAFQSDTGFTTASVEVLDYDLAASSVAFVGMTEFGASATPVPVPAGGLLLGAAILALGTRRHARQPG